MELITLDTDFHARDVVESYQSLIWSERYHKNGDFELKTNDISNALNLLPLESYVSLRDSTVPMVVEAHKIEKPKNQAPLLTVTGRSFETVTERRVTVVTDVESNETHVAWRMTASKPSDLAFLILRKILGDAPQYQSGIMVLPLIDPAVSPLDAIPEIALTLPADYQTPAWSSTLTYSPGDLVGSGTTIYQATSLTSPINQNKSPGANPTYWTVLSTGHAGTWGDANMYEIAADYLYNAVINLIGTNYRGIKAVRPVGDEITTNIEIYNGADLTSQLTFDAKFDQFDDAAYLLSKQGSANVAYVLGNSGSSKVLKTTATEPSGLERRVLLVDYTSDTSVTNEDSRYSRGIVDLYNNNVTALFDGALSQYLVAKYNVDYYLGDIVNLVGEFGLYQYARVVEFIRTSDSTGEKAYPTFEAVTG
jgi:hypothetical protein